MKMLRVLIPLTVLSVGASSALADFDVSPTVSGNQIQTNAISDATGQFVTNVRVFNFAFDDPTTPGFTQDPGFHTPLNSGFAPSTAVSVSPITALTYWSGTGSPTFGMAPNDPTLKLAFGLTSATANNTAPSGTVLIGNTDSSGALHEHIESSLTGPGGQTPASGIYMVGLKLTDPQYSDSQPFYALYNNGGLSDDQVTAAKTYVRDTLAPGSNLAVAPEPSGVCLLALGACGLLVRRRARADAA